MIPWTAVTLLALAALLVAERRGSRLGKWLTKPLASVGFVAVAVAAGARGSPVGQALLAGLALSLVGDVCLISHRRAAFLGGLFAFLLGHVAFAVAFLLRGLAPLPTLLGLLATTAVALAVGRWLLPHVDRKMKPPVVAYIVVISAMVGLAIGSFAAHPNPLLLAAAIAFFCSDLAVARDRFVAPGFANRLWGLPVYYGAQLLFAWGILNG